jgi:hypothetical protein
MLSIFFAKLVGLIMDVFDALDELETETGLSGH